MTPNLMNNFVMKLKHALKLLFSGVYVKIKSGPLKGKKWSIASGYKFIRGNYEQYKTNAFLEHFRRGSIFFDIGAHIGYYFSIAAEVNKSSGHIYAFEPRPMNIRFFRKHIGINKFENITLYEAAAGETDGMVRFDDNHGSATGFVTSEGNLEVRLSAPLYNATTCCNKTLPPFFFHLIFNN